MAGMDTNGRKTERSTVLKNKLKVFVHWLENLLVKTKNIPR